MSEPSAIVEFSTRHMREAVEMRVETTRAHHALHPNVFAAAPDDAAMWRELQAYVPRWRWGRRRSHFGLAAVHNNDDLCGYLLYVVYPQSGPSFKKATASMIIDITVTKLARGNGIGRALIDRYVEIARERGISCFYANIWEGNTASAELFKVAGFRPECRTFAMFRD